MNKEKIKELSLKIENIADELAQDDLAYQEVQDLLWSAQAELLRTIVPEDLTSYDLTSYDLHRAIFSE